MKILRLTNVEIELRDDGTAKIRWFDNRDKSFYLELTRQDKNELKKALSEE